MFVEILLFISTLSFFLLCATKYNSLKVFRKRIQTAITSNSWWAIYFATVAIWSFLACIKFALQGESERKINKPFVIIDLVFYGFIPWSLCSALEHQRAHRTSITGGGHHKLSSGEAWDPRAVYAAHNDDDDPWSHAFAPPPLPQSSGRTDPLLKQCDRCHRRYLVHSILFLLLLQYFIFMILAVTGGDSIDEADFYYAFVGSFALQRLPILILGGAILLDSRLPYYGLTLPNSPNDDGPSRTSKLCLLLGLLCSLPDLIPITLWDVAFGSHCAFYICSWVDVFQIIYGISALCFFLFTRSEYFRSLEHELWHGESTSRYTTISPLGYQPLP